jgi:hypothetical protein
VVLGTRSWPSSGHMGTGVPSSDSSEYATDSSVTSVNWFPFNFNSFLLSESSWRKLFIWFCVRMNCQSSWRSLPPTACLVTNSEVPRRALRSYKQCSRHVFAEWLAIPFHSSMPWHPHMLHRYVLLASLSGTSVSLQLCTTAMLALLAGNWNVQRWGMSTIY